MSTRHETLDSPNPNQQLEHDISFQSVDGSERGVSHEELRGVSGSLGSLTLGEELAYLVKNDKFALRPGEESRADFTDIAEAEAAARTENEIFDEKALATAKADKKITEAEETTAQPEEQELVASNASAEKTTSVTSERQQVEKALVEAGYPPAYATGLITKDISGKITISNGNTTKIIEPALGGAMSVSEYSLDDNGVLSITQYNPGGVIGKKTEYVSADKTDYTNSKVITLPPAIAQMAVKLPLSRTPCLSPVVLAA